MKKSNLCNSLLQLNRKGTKQLPLIAFLLLLFLNSAALFFAIYFYILT